jgi:hypothetical protein
VDFKTHRHAQYPVDAAQTAQSSYNCQQSFAKRICSFSEILTYSASPGGELHFSLIERVQAVSISHIHNIYLKPLTKSNFAVSDFHGDRARFEAGVAEPIDLVQRLSLTPLQQGKDM